jgi:hypothetical protein
MVIGGAATRTIGMVNSDRMKYLIIAFIAPIVYVLNSSIINMGFLGQDSKTAFSPKPPSENGDSTVYGSSFNQLLFIATCFMFVSFIVAVFVPEFMKSWVPFIIFFVSAGMGLLPLVVFLILLNFWLANLIPIAEMVLLVVYRFVGFIPVFGGDAGAKFLHFFGLKTNEGWSMPLLNFVTWPVRLYYMISGEPKPTYFDDSGIASGVSNSDMWLS